MKTKTLTAALILLTATFITGCNKDENDPVQRPDGKIELSAASFTLSEHTAFAHGKICRK